MIHFAHCSISCQTSFIIILMSALDYSNNDNTIMLSFNLIRHLLLQRRLIFGCVDKEKEQLLQADCMNRRPDYALCICERENLECALYTVYINIHVNSSHSFLAEDSGRGSIKY